MGCEHCGAPVRETGAFCEHCGGRRRPAAPVPVHIAATAVERFDLVTRHPGYEKACQHRPTLTTTPVTSAWVAVVFSVVGTIAAIVFILYLDYQREESHRRFEAKLASMDLSFEQSFRDMGVTGVEFEPVKPTKVELPRDGGPLMILWILAPVCLLGVGFAVRGLVKAQRFADAPMRHEVGVVVDERVSVHHGPRNSSRAQYHATIQSRDGARREYLCEGQLAGRIAAPDIGVAFLKADHLVDFIRFEV